MMLPRVRAIALSALLGAANSGIASSSPAVGEWTTSPGQVAADDNSADGPVLTAPKQGLVLENKTTLQGDRQLHAWVRMCTKDSATASADFQMGGTPNADTGLAIHLTAERATDTITASVTQDGNALHDIAALSQKLNWKSPLLNSFEYHLRAYDAIQPGWPEDFRRRIEQDMSGLPDHNAKWMEVRIELHPGRVRFWLDDRLVAQKDDPAVKADRSAKIILSEGVQLGQFDLAPLGPEARDFLPLRLGGYLNALSFSSNVSIQGSSLPSPDSVTNVGDVPFLFPGLNREGKDHLDIGRSLYRTGNLEGYFPTYQQSWGGSAYRDPARIQLRIPNGPYNCLYLIAASADVTDSIPDITAMFYRPGVGMSECFETRVPPATIQSEGSDSLPVRFSDGRAGHLWLVKIPLNPARLASFSDLDTIEVELTKKVYPYRSYPDPIIYGQHQGGAPSAVQVYAATLGVAPVGFELNADRFGGVWTAPAVPSYEATISNRTSSAQSGRLIVTTKSYDGTEETTQAKPVTIDKEATAKIQFPVPVKLNGYHDLTATLELAGQKWTEQRSFTRLAADNRAPRWTEGKGSLFGYWSYSGGHYTPNADRQIELMTEAGARTSVSAPPENNAWVQDHWSPVITAFSTPTPPWSKEDHYDPKAYTDYQQSTISGIENTLSLFPAPYQPSVITFFAEPTISLRLTDGNYPEYWGEPSYTLTDEEKTSEKSFFITAKAAGEAVRAKWPEKKILIPYGDPLFVVPLLRAGFPSRLIDGSALDNPGFERLPEQQLHQISLHRLYVLRKEFAKAGIPNPRLVYAEGIFVPTEIGSCTWREQMDIYNRWTLLSIAYGVTQFYSGWFAFDCGDYYGAEHYGGCGIQRRIPYCDPKPAYAAFATMTDQLGQANFEGWLKTGSLSTYCLHFNGPKGQVYTLWTLRGSRPVTLTLANEGKVRVTDAMNNTQVMQSQGKKIVIQTDPSVIYVSTGETIESVTVGDPENGDAKPSPNALPVADLGDGSWKYSSERDPIYENNNFDTFRYLGKFSQSVVQDPTQGAVLASKLEKQDKVHELMPWYNVLTPSHPISLRGAPARLGLWVKGASDWGRVVYSLRDAKGERWISVGSKDEWNCDDIHSWSSFNFDGWRYLTFELPGHAGYDSFRKSGTTWWRAQGGDGVVDLPLTLEKIIVEQRSHVLYVNDVQPAESDTVCLGKLEAEYEFPDDSMPEAVALSKVRMPPTRETSNLPNPIAEMKKQDVGNPPIITKLEPPDAQNDGTQVHVYFSGDATAAIYSIWCSPHEDGSDAVNMTPNGAKSGELIEGLRPTLKLYFWVVAENDKNQLSKPSAAESIILTDQFKEK